ncbi:hypothetical protein TNCV_2994461 [Trichonephila clavipes]|nr:hypothetical protein TNCV_2994461 [Trichonephila clavipes]
MTVDFLILDHSQMAITTPTHTTARDDLKRYLRIIATMPTIKVTHQVGNRDFLCVIHAELVLDESRSFFRVHTGYFSNIPKCIKAEFIASWACSQSSVVSSSQR